MTAYDFSISGQHYLFDVQSFAHTILAAGGDSYSYALRDRTTPGPRAPPSWAWTS